MILEPEKKLLWILTVLWDLPRAPLQEETDTPAPRLDQLDGSAVGHVPGALSVDLNDLVPNLDVGKVCDEGGKHL